MVGLAFFWMNCQAEEIPNSQYEALPVDMEICQAEDSPIGKGFSAFQVEGHFVWGASVLQSEEDGKYYMVYSAPEGKGEYPFNQAWVYGSKLGLAVSDRPDGGFRQLGFFLNEDGFAPDTSAWDAQTVMNPHLRRFNGKYYLYYVGGREATHLPIQAKDGGRLDKRSRIQQMLCIGVISFDTFDDLRKGIFKRSQTPLLSPRTRVKPDDIVNPSPLGTQPKPDNIIVVNPSVVYRPSDGKYLLYFKGNIYDPYWRGIHGVALSDSPEGPFVPLDIPVFDLPSSDGQKLSAEDPYVWYNQKEKLFYAIFKDFTGHFTHAEPCLAIMYSKDGIHWELPKHSLFMKKELILRTGDTIKVDRLERPQLLLNDNGDPLVLYADCSIKDLNAKSDGSSFNVQIPLKKIKQTGNEE